ncbi:GntR family transcriptional regulator [Nocardia sp. KC 131]|uniref:GntR family transcriptional regulator n=1 Tax=Nocardia arseniciresistens TaxID=3392119 RepID=UPI00398F5AF0
MATELRGGEEHRLADLPARIRGRQQVHRPHRLILPTAPRPEFHMGRITYTYVAASAVVSMRGVKSMAVAGPEASRRRRKQAPVPAEDADFVRPKTTQQAVTDALRQEIVTGARPPGSPIVQEALAERFGMSRIPIREALKTLEAEEHVTYAPHAGYRVTKLSIEELEEVFRIREILEEELIRDALPRVTEATVAEMREAMANMDAAVADSDLVAVGITNRKFHNAVFEWSKLARTKRIVNQLWDTADAYRPLYTDLMDLSAVTAEHEQFIEAVSARDVEHLVRLNYAHRRHAVALLGRALAEPTE